MSWEATAHVLKLAEQTDKHELNSTQILVLLTLAARHHRDICCAFGQYKRMEADTHLDDDTIIRAINYLEACDYIRVFYGPLPLKTRSGRPLMGNLYCFVGLDPEEGPNMDGVQPRRRLGGRPSSAGSSGTPNWGSSATPDGERPGVTVEVTRSDTPNPPGLTRHTSSGRASGVSDPPTPPRLTGTKLTGNREPEEKNNGKPVGAIFNEEIDGRDGRKSHANGHDTDAAQLAFPPILVAAASDQVPAGPKRLENGGLWCDDCQHRFLNLVEFNGHLAKCRRLHAAAAQAASS